MWCNHMTRPTCHSIMWKDPLCHVTTSHALLPKYLPDRSSHVRDSLASVKKTYCFTSRGIVCDNLYYKNKKMKRDFKISYTLSLFTWSLSNVPLPEKIHGKLVADIGYILIRSEVNTATPQIPPIPFKVLCKCLLRKLFLIDQKVISNNFVITFCWDTLKSLRKSFVSAL